MWVCVVYELLLYNYVGFFYFLGGVIEVCFLFDSVIIFSVDVLIELIGEIIILFMVD